MNISEVETYKKYVCMHYTYQVIEKKVMPIKHHKMHMIGNFLSFIVSFIIFLTFQTNAMEIQGDDPEEDTYQEEYSGQSEGYTSVSYSDSGFASGDDLYFGTDSRFIYVPPSSESTPTSATVSESTSSSAFGSHQGSPTLSQHKLIVLFEKFPSTIHQNLTQREMSPLTQLPTPIIALQNIQFTNGENIEISSFTIFNSAAKPNHPELQFMKKMDQYFFRKVPLGENFGPGIIFATWWPTATFATAGAVMYSTADFLQIPYGKGGAIATVVWLLATHATVYWKQFFRIGQSIGDYFCNEKPFPSQSDEEDACSPHIYRKYRSHYAMIAAAYLAAGIHATTSMFYFFLAESPFPVFAWSTGEFLFLSELERYAARANLDINRRFTRLYDVEEEKRQAALHKKNDDTFSGLPYGINRMRQFLLLKAKRFQEELENDKFVDASYDIISAATDQISSEGKIDTKPYFFQLSLFFLRDPSFFRTFDHKSNIHNPKPQKENNEIDPDDLNSLYTQRYLSQAREIDRQKKTIVHLEEQNKKLFNSKTVEQSLQTTLIDDLYSRVSSGLIDAAWFARWVGMEYLIETTFIQLFSTDPTLAYVVAHILSGYEVLFKSATEYSTQVRYMEEFLRNPFSLRKHISLPWLRKTVGACALVNGVFSALGKTVASLTAFNSWCIPLPFQLVAVGSDFVVNTCYYAQFHEQENNSLITDLATAYATGKTKENMTITQKRLWLHHWSNKITPFIETEFDGKTIQSLFRITQRAL